MCLLCPIKKAKIFLVGAAIGAVVVYLILKKKEEETCCQ